MGLVDPFSATRWLEHTEQVLATGNRTEQWDAYDALMTWHRTFHSRNRPPDLPCTGCRVWPVLMRLRKALERP